MKTTTKLLIGTLALVFLQNRTNAQSTQTGLGALGHLNGGGVANYYVGWNAASTIPLSIEHRGNFPINFSTNNFQRMTINHLAFGMPLVPFSAPPFNNLNTLPGTRLTRVGISYDGGKPDGADL